LYSAGKQKKKQDVHRKDTKNHSAQAFRRRGRTVCPGPLREKFSLFSPHEALTIWLHRGGGKERIRRVDRGEEERLILCIRRGGRKGKVVSSWGGSRLLSTGTVMGIGTLHFFGTRKIGGVETGEGLAPPHKVKRNESPHTESEGTPSLSSSQMFSSSQGQGKTPQLSLR